MEISGLSVEVLTEALKVQEDKGGRIGEILIDRKAVSETDVSRGLGIQFGLPFRPSLPTEDLKTDFTQQIPIQFLKKYKMVPVANAEGTLIAINDPMAFQPLDDLRLALGWNGVQTIVAPYSAILSAINFSYDMARDSAEQVIEGMHGEWDAQHDLPAHLPSRPRLQEGRSGQWHRIEHLLPPGRGLLDHHRG